MTHVQRMIKKATGARRAQDQAREPLGACLGIALSAPAPTHAD